MSNLALLALGPCPTCGKYFESRDRKTFCSMVCYHRSDRFKEIVKKRAAAQTVEDPRSCIACGAEFVTKPSSKSRYCSKICQRRWFAERHDRWVANPQKIALPQAYDEFLSQDELSCIVEGCGWTGRSLGQHVNFVHGIPVREFKAAAGFNRNTGLVCADLSQILSDRPYAHLRENPSITAVHVAKMRAAAKEKDQSTTERRLESRELSRKHLAERRAIPAEQTYRCVRCKTLFVKTGIKRSAKYCDPCRPLAHAERHAAKNTPLVCSECRDEYLGNSGQRLRAAKGLVSYCSVCLAKEQLSKLAEGRAKFAKRPKKAPPQRGPCPTCGKMFRHYAPMKFCSRACYQSSDGFKEMLAKNLETMNAKRHPPSTE